MNTQVKVKKIPAEKLRLTFCLKYKCGTLSILMTAFSKAEIQFLTK